MNFGRLLQFGARGDGESNEHEAREIVARMVRLVSRVRTVRNAAVIAYHTDRKKGL